MSNQLKWKMASVCNVSIVYPTQVEFKVQLLKKTLLSSIQLKLTCSYKLVIGHYCYNNCQLQIKSDWNNRSVTNGIQNLVIIIIQSYNKYRLQRCDSVFTGISMIHNCQDSMSTYLLLQQI